MNIHKFHYAHILLFMSLFICLFGQRLRQLLANWEFTTLVICNNRLMKICNSATEIVLILINLGIIFLLPEMIPEDFKLAVVCIWELE